MLNKYLFLGIYLILLSILSLYVIFIGLIDEPFLSIDIIELITEVGLGFSLLMLWGQIFILYSVYLIKYRRFIDLFVILWGSLLCFMIFISIETYVTQIHYSCSHYYHHDREITRNP